MSFHVFQVILLDLSGLLYEPDKYNDNVEYHRMHPNILLPKDKDHMENMETHSPQLSSRSVLKQVSNQDNVLEVHRVMFYLGRIGTPSAV